MHEDPKPRASIDLKFETLHRQWCRLHMKDSYVGYKKIMKKSFGGAENVARSSRYYLQNSVKRTDINIR
jgi:hypothetical protein